jgi:hypothetical protein
LRFGWAVCNHSQVRRLKEEEEEQRHINDKVQRHIDGASNRSSTHFKRFFRNTKIWRYLKQIWPR